MIRPKAPRNLALASASTVSPTFTASNSSLHRRPTAHHASAKPVLDASSYHAKTNENNETALYRNLNLDFDFQADADAAAAAAVVAALGTASAAGDAEADFHYNFAATDKSKASSIISSEHPTSYSEGTLLSSVQTEGSDTLTARSGWSRGLSPLESVSVTETSPNAHALVYLGPHCQEAFNCDGDLGAHKQSAHTYICNWAGCNLSSFESRDDLNWHVKAEHLVVCPSPGCTEDSFQNPRMLQSHIAVAHPESGKRGVWGWQLSTILPGDCNIAMPKPAPRNSSGKLGQAARIRADSVHKASLAVIGTKRKCREQLWKVVEKKAKKTTNGTPGSAESPTDMVRSKAPQLVQTASFPLVFEHAILPFLAEIIPKWCGPRHVISVTRGRTPQMKRICIMTAHDVSRARKIAIAGHVQDLLPANFGHIVSFVFSTGQVNRMTWARGLSQQHLDDICSPRNPFCFQTPCMGDSIGIRAGHDFEESTATLGPCLRVGGGDFWLANFHPFLDAYQSVQTVEVEHPSPSDRARCINEKHDTMAPGRDFCIGNLAVTSGLNLQTTRISHNPYWEECDKENPLVVTDWALIGSQSSQANILRRFPSETQSGVKEPIINTMAPTVPGALVISSGRTSGHQRGQICEIPAYISGDENGTEKATREWFIEEPYPYDDEESWIRGGIGIEGDSGAAIVDEGTGGLVGQLWGRNYYWGPGPRHTFFTPLGDIFDDIQEKCGQQTRPQLPQDRDEAECYPMYPSCRQCYDLRAYQDSRRSSRVSLQSMVMGTGDNNQDVNTIEDVSELATPQYCPRPVSTGEVLFQPDWDPYPLVVHNPYSGAPGPIESKSPYATALESDEELSLVARLSGSQESRKRAAPSKRRAADSEMDIEMDGQTSRKRTNFGWQRN